MKTLRLLAALLAFFLAGCAAPTPIATVSATNTSPAPTLVASATTQPPEATVQTTTTQPATSTPDARQQEQAALLPLVAPCNFADQAISYSPNRTWGVVTCLGDQPETGTITKFVRLDGSQTWSLTFDKIYLKPYRTGDPNLSTLIQTAFLPVRWTKNEDFVYLAIETSTTNSPFKGADGLFRLDLATGKSRPVLKPAIAPLTTTYAFKFSPGGNKLAYLNQAVQPVTIVIIETASGAEQKITLDARFSQGGSLLWSQDEKQLIVSVLDPGQNGGNAVISYDLETHKNQYLIQQSATIYLPLAWVDSNTLYAESYPGNWVYLDLLTQAVRPAPAPTPAP